MSTTASTTKGICANDEYNDNTGGGIDTMNTINNPDHNNNNNKIIESLSFFSNRVEEILKSSVEYYSDPTNHLIRNQTIHTTIVSDNDKTDTDVVTTKNNNPPKKVASFSKQYAQIGVIYRKGIAIADLTTTTTKNNHYLSSYQSSEDENEDIHNDTTTRTTTAAAALDHDHLNQKTKPISSGSKDSGNDSNDNDNASSSGSNASSSDSESESDNDMNQEQRYDNNNNNNNNNNTSTKKSKHKQSKKEILTEKQQEQIIRKQWETVPVVRIPLPPLQVKRTDNDSSSSTKSRVLELPSALLAKEDHFYSNDNNDDDNNDEKYRKVILRQCRLYQTIINQFRNYPKCKMVVFFIRSGRFAGGVFGTPSVQSSSSSTTPNTIKRSMDCCITHRTSVRYTVRKGQGKAQSNQDGQRRAKSMGSQLRRDGELKLYADIHRTIVEWNTYIQEATYIFLSVPKTMMKSLFHGTIELDTIGTVNVQSIWNKNDTRIRKVPLDVGKPSYENICYIHTIMTTGMIREVVQLPVVQPQQQQQQQNDDDNVTSIRNRNNQSDKNQLDCIEKKKIDFLPLNPLHIAARDGDIQKLKSLLLLLSVPQKNHNSSDTNDEGDNTDTNTSTTTEKVITTTTTTTATNPEESDMTTPTVSDIEEWKNARGGENYLTPLHYAANAAATTTTTTTTSVSGTPNTSTDVVGAVDNGAVDINTAAECVRILLIDYRCDPCILDIRNRVPYYLASHDKIREAFRIGRGTIGEEYCAWDKDSKIGPPLSFDIIEIKKQKEADKKRIKRQKQKEKQQIEKQNAILLKKQQEKDEEEKIKLLNQQRVRDGLQAVNKKDVILPPGGKLCDYCSKVCVGKHRTNMFQRLNYFYCTTNCVQEHKRTLMANAALARFK